MKHAPGGVELAAVASESVTREYFSGHSQQVICLGFVEHSSQMVSLDASGQLLLWQYRQEHYSSFGWFRPSRQKQRRVHGARFGRDQ